MGSVKQIKGKGRLLVLKRTENRACYAGEGDPIYESDTLYTLADCRCRLEFTDQNVIVMAARSHLDIDEVYASLFQGVKRSRFKMNQGKAIFYALRLFRYRSMQFELKTPTASIGVRGTKFGTEIEEGVPGSSQNVLTRVYVLEGEIDVTSLIDGRIQRLQENEILEADRRGLGSVVLDLEKTRSFQGDVLSGIAETPDPEPRILRDEFRREELDRMNRMDDIRQRQMETPIHE
ncbi:MAG: FecR family protein, partial [Pseudomonadota bacterium]